MYSLYSLARLSLFATLLLGLAQPACATPMQNAVAVVSDQNATNTPQAVDNSEATAATLTAPALLGNARLRLGFGSVVPAGGVGELIIQVGANVDASAFNNITINTYMGSGTTPEESIAVSSLVNLTVVSAGKTTVEFPVNKPFNQVELRTSGLLNASFSVDLFSAYGTLAAPLPVELAMFQGKSTATGTALAWSTASERNSDYFVVERADNASESFRAIGRVQGAGSSSHRIQYDFVDARPAALGYYRLRQVDRDGTNSFSPVVLVKKAEFSLPLTVYPSPATETVVVVGTVGTRFGLFDQLGRRLLAAGVLPGACQSLDVRALPAGTYFVRNLDTGSSVRLVKAQAIQ